jgi:hypothetical protein
MKICEVREEINETWVMVFYSILIVQCTTVGVNIHGCMHPALPNGHILSPFILHVIVVDMGAILCQM